LADAVISQVVSPYLKKALREKGKEGKLCDGEDRVDSFASMHAASSSRRTDPLIILEPVFGNR